MGARAKWALPKPFLFIYIIFSFKLKKDGRKTQKLDRLQYRALRGGLVHINRTTRQL
jgi:hypothetical protein